LEQVNIWLISLAHHRRSLRFFIAPLSCVTLTLAVIIVLLWGSADPYVTLHPSGGFARHGEYPSRNGGATRTIGYGSWTGSDTHRGSLTSDPFRAGVAIRLLVAGYPSHAGESIELERVSDRARLALVFSRDPAETWSSAAFRIPITWWGADVRLRAVDRSQAYQGWIGIADVRPASFMAVMLLGAVDAWTIVAWLVLTAVVVSGLYSAFRQVHRLQRLANRLAPNNCANSGRFLPMLEVAVLAVLLAGRRPSAILSPQLWAEDGPVYLSLAFVEGPIRSVFEPYAGYAQLFPRLVTALAALIPTRFIPMCCALSSIAVAVWASSMFTAPRYRSVVRSDALRFALCCALVCFIPAAEIYGNMTNAHWYFSLGVLFLLLAHPVSTSAAANLRDNVLVFVGVLSGAECLVLVPLAGWRSLCSRGWNRCLPISFLVAAAIQLVVLQQTFRLHKVTDAWIFAISTFNAYIDRVVISAVTGTRVADAVCVGVLHLTFSRVLISLACLSLLALGLAAGRNATRYVLCIVLGLAWTAVALGGRGLAEAGAVPGVIWTGSDTGGRYFVLPMAAFLLAVALVLDGMQRIDTASKTAAFCLMFLSASILDYRMNAMPDNHWQRYASALTEWKNAKYANQAYPSLQIPIIHRAGHCSYLHYEGDGLLRDRKSDKNSGVVDSNLVRADLTSAW
jgi:hypothetical protein